VKKAEARLEAKGKAEHGLRIENGSHESTHHQRRRRPREDSGRSPARIEGRKVEIHQSDRRHSTGDMLDQVTAMDDLELSLKRRSYTDPPVEKVERARRFDRRHRRMEDDRASMGILNEHQESGYVSRDSHRRHSTISSGSPSRYYRGSGEQALHQRNQRIESITSEETKGSRTKRVSGKNIAPKYRKMGCEVEHEVDTKRAGDSSSRISEQDERNKRVHYRKERRGSRDVHPSPQL
jgi:hypothetical protein